MKKRLFALALLLCMALSLLPFSASAAQEVLGGRCGDDVTWTLDSDGLLTISGTGKMYGPYDDEDDGESSISGSIKKAGYGDLVKTAVINPGVTSINSFALRGLKNLESVSIPASISQIGEAAFSGCTGLKRVEISDVAAWCGINFSCDPWSDYPSYYESNPLYYGHELRLNGETVTDLVIPDGVEKINAHAFFYADISSVTVPSSVTFVGDEAFQAPDRGYVHCYYDGTVVQWLGLQECFTENDPFRSPVYLHADDYEGSDFGRTNRERGGLWVYYPEEHLMRLSGTGTANLIFEEPDHDPCDQFPEYYCTETQTLVIDPGITCIGESLFSGFRNIESISIPTSVKELEPYSFSSKCNVQDIYYAGDSEQWNSVSKTRCGLPDSARVHYRVADAAEHVSQISVTRVEPTCTQPGYEVSQCSCGYDYGERKVLPATGHDWGAWTVTTPATATSAGVETRVCRNDPSHVETRAVTLPLAITAQPKNASATGSNTAAFTVKATGSCLTYQWQYRTSASATWHDCTSLTKGYNTAALTVAGVSNSINRNGFQYRCVVTDAAGASVTSNVATLTVKLAAPTLTVKLNAKGQPVLTWTASSCAAKYEIWRATSESGTYTKLSTISSRELTNSSAKVGTTYYYKVRALATDGTPGVFSAVKSAKAALAAPTLTVKLNAKGQPYLTWTAVTGAAKYEIWRATSENGTYSKLSTTTGKSLTNSSAKVGTTYYYKVRAVDANGNSGVFSAVKSAKASLAALTLTVKLNAKGQPYLTWTAVTGAAKYEVWRATSANGTYTKLASTTGKSLTNSSAKVGTTYYYKVRAVDANGNTGVFSAVKSAKASLAAPTLTVKLNAKGQPYLMWTAVTGAAKYEIWRATSADGTYTKLSTTTGKSLTNSSAASGVTYYYKVRAVDASGNAGVFSTVKSVTAK